MGSYSQKFSRAACYTLFVVVVNGLDPFFGICCIGVLICKDVHCAWRRSLTIREPADRRRVPRLALLTNLDI